MSHAISIAAWGSDHRYDILDVVSFPDARETGHNTAETNLYDTEMKQYGDKA